MKRTQKYSQACEILTIRHSTQDELYNELNRLGWYWEPDIKKWNRDTTKANPPTNKIRVRVWGDAQKIREIAQHFVEAGTDRGLRFVEMSEPYPNRPPNQNESRVYITFDDVENDT